MLSRQVRWPLARTVWVALLLASGWIGGCAFSNHTSGRPIEDSKVALITNGVTTIEEIITTFGAPTVSSEMAGNILYTYRFTQTRGSTYALPYVTTSGGNDTSDELTITFDKATGKVKAHSLQRGIK